MDQSYASRTAPIGTFNIVFNCRKRGPKGVLECRPGRSQIASTCLGEAKHYIAGDGINTYIYRPCFITRIYDTPLLGTTAGEAFAYASGLWTFCGRFSTCLPIKKHVIWAPTKLAPNSAAGGMIFPPQVAVNSSGFVMSGALDSAGHLQVCLDSPDGVRQAIAWSSTTSIQAFRIVAIGTKFFLWWQSGATIAANSYIPASGSGGITYAELGSTTLASSAYYWDVFVRDPNTSTEMCLVFGSADRTIALNVFNSSLALTHSATKNVGSGPIPMSIWQHPTTNEYWLGFNDASGGLTGTDTNATVNTTVNRTIRIRTSKASSYTVINVTAGAATPKATIAADLNTGFGGAGLTLTASVVGTNQIKIVNTSTATGVPGYLIDVDSVANGSNLNTAVGFPAAQSDTFGGETYAVFSSALAVVLNYATIASSLSLGASNYGPPLFGYARGATPIDAVAGTGLYAFSLLTTTFGGARQVTIGTCDRSGTVATNAILVNMFAVSKPDNYGRIWMLLDAGFAASRYALLRFFDTTADSTTLKLLSPPTIELVTDAFPDISVALNDDNGNTNKVGRFFSSAASTGSAYMYPLWAPVSQIGGQTIGASLKTFTQPAGVLAQAQVYEYSAVEFDEPKDTHRDVDAIQETVLISGQPLEMFGAPTAEFVNGFTGASTAFAYSAGASEVGFLHPPGALTLSTGASVSAVPGMGTFLYKAVYQWVDAFGRRHQSAPTASVSYTNDGTHTVRVTVTIIQTSQRASRNTAQAIEIIIYRTVAGGTQFHETTMRATIDDAASTLSISFEDDLSDANISSNAFLYTDGGVLANDIAPSCRFSCRADERMWFGGLWDPTLIQCSKIIVPGEPVETPESDSFRVQLLRPCTALSFMDGQVIAFAKDAIFLINGDGPNDQGNGGFSVRPLTLTIGCIDYRSVIETEDGVLFQSTRGLYLIPRGFSPPQFIGAAIQDIWGAFSSGDAQPEVLSAAYSLTNQGSWAKFLIRDGSSFAGGSIVALMDTDSGEWFLDSFPEESRELGYLTRSVDLGIGPGSLFAAPTFDTATGALSPVLYETVTDRFDYPHNGSTKSVVTMSVRSSSMTPFGLAGWGRFNKTIGSFETDTVGIVYTMRFFPDDGSNQTSASWTMSDAFSVNIAQYRERQIVSPQCTAGAFTLELVPQDTNVTANYTCKFIGWSAEVEPSDGIRQMAAEERA